MASNTNSCPFPYVSFDSVRYILYFCLLDHRSVDWNTFVLLYSTFGSRVGIKTTERSCAFYLDHHCVDVCCVDHKTLRKNMCHTVRHPNNAGRIIAGIVLLRCTWCGSHSTPNGFSSHQRVHLNNRNTSLHAKSPKNCKTRCSAVSVLLS